jgi:predicted nuclease of predicted toxin-antitoxin system
VRLYADENFPRASVEALRVLGHDVVTAAEAGHANLATPDEDVLAFATAERRAVVTLNRRDFIRLSRISEHHGIIVCTANPDHLDLAKRIHLELEKRTELRDELVRINRPG